MYLGTFYNSILHLLYQSKYTDYFLSELTGFENITIQCYKYIL